MKKHLLSFLSAALLFPALNSETMAASGDSPVEVKPSASIVSSYVWRGMYQSGAAIQPGITMSVKGFSLGVWGSTDFTGQGHKEFDVNLSYSVAGVTLSLSDYWWAGESGIKNADTSGRNRYFDWKASTTNHILEAGLSYELPFEKCPFKFSWYTMFWGGDKNISNDQTRQAYSSYFELSCPFNAGPVVLTPSVGCSPWTSASCYLNKGFAVTGISLKAGYDLKLTESFSLPLSVQAIWNPDRQDIHCVFCFSF